jgi:hypothetical protein
MENNKKKQRPKVRAEYVSCTRDILGKMEKVKIREIKTDKIKTVTEGQLKKAMQAGLISVNGVAISSKGELYKRKKKNRKANTLRKRKIERYQKELQQLEESGLKDIETTNRMIFLKREIEDLRDYKRYREESGAKGKKSEKI